MGSFCWRTAKPANSSNATEIAGQPAELAVGQCQTIAEGEKGQVGPWQGNHVKSLCRDLRCTRSLWERAGSRSASDQSYMHPAMI